MAVAPESESLRAEPGSDCPSPTTRPYEINYRHSTGSDQSTRATEHQSIRASEHQSIRASEQSSGNVPGAGTPPEV